MRRVIRAFSGAHTAMYRLTKGAAGNPNWPMLVLTVTGRKSGKTRRVPLVYIKDNENFIVAAAYGGSDVNPAWWRNLRANPHAEVLTEDTRLPVHAAQADDQQRIDLWPRLVDMYPYFAEYQRRTTRQIPVMVLTPEREAASNP